MELESAPVRTFNVNEKKTEFKNETVYLNYKNFYNINQKRNKKIISFSLYSCESQLSKSRGFYNGIYVNYYLAKTLYPDYTVRVYMPYNEPKHIIEELIKFTDIELILIDTNTCLRALRYLVYDDEDVDVWLSRDLDSVLNEKEVKAVDDWLINYPEKEMQIMADHDQHRWEVAGGMFGFKNKSQNQSYVDFLLKFSIQIKNHNNYSIDCDIAKEFFLKENNYIQHYGAGKKLQCSKPFPEHAPITSRFVGNIVNMNNLFENLKLDIFGFKLADNDLFLYKPWNTKCVVTWYNEKDFIIKPIKTSSSTATESACFKTENGDGAKMVKSRDSIFVKWDDNCPKRAWVQDTNKIAIVHDSQIHYFEKV